MAPKRILKFDFPYTIRWRDRESGIQREETYLIRVYFLKYNKYVINYTIDDLLKMVVKKNFKININYETFNILCVSEDCCCKLDVPYFVSDADDYIIENKRDLENYLHDMIDKYAPS